MTTEQIYTHSPIAARWANMQPVARMITFDDVVTTVCEFMDVDKKVPFKKTRERSVVFPRQVCMYFLIRKTRISLKNIGHSFGGRDHTTVIHAANLVKDLIESDPAVNRMIHQIDAAIDCPDMPMKARLRFQSTNQTAII